MSDAATPEQPNNESGQTSRRDWMATVCMGAGLAAAYGFLAVQGVMFLLPTRLRPKTRRIFAGLEADYASGAVKTFHDLQGNPIMVKKGTSGLEAFSSTCPHLGCKVLWEAENNRFFCPCHGGAFDSSGEPTLGPPVEASPKQKLIRVPVEAVGGVVYLQVKDIKTS